MNLKLVRDNFTHYGLQAGLHDIARKTVGRVVRLQVLDCLELTLPRAPKEFLAAPPGLECRFLSEEELLGMADAAANQLDAPFIRRAAGRGDRCYGILRGGALASYGWYSRLPTDIGDGIRLHFDPQDVYMYKGFTLPAFRGQRLHAVGMARALAAYTEAGARGLVSYVESNNFASLRSCQRLGYAEIGRLFILRPRRQLRCFSTGRCAERGLWVEGTATAGGAGPRP